MLAFIRSHIPLFLKGIAMGAADVVPGVSGGTIAFVTGIYNELLESIKRCGNPELLKVLFTKGPVAAWEYTNATFLVTLFSGIACSLFSLAHVVTWLLENEPVFIWSFFFGLIIGSAWHVLKELPGLGAVEVIGILAGILFMLWLALANPPQPPETLWFVFVSGAIAICAMILPGISGSFILLILGMYQYIMGAIKSLDLVVFGVFFAGTVVGLLSFSHVLSWLLRRFHRATFAVLTGFLAGSLFVIWPWREVISTAVRHGKEVPLNQQPVMPATWAEINGQDPQIILACVAVVAGFILVLGLEQVGKRAGK